MTPHEEKDALERALLLLADSRDALCRASEELSGVRGAMALHCRCADPNLAMAKLYADVHALLDTRIKQGDQR